MLEKFRLITTFVFDVDGVLTDGSLLVLPGGVMARRMNIKDGYALQLAVKKGYKVVVISGGNSLEVKERLVTLGVTEVWMQVTDKAGTLHNYMQKEGLSSDSVLFMGYEIPDLQVILMEGRACCRADAVHELEERYQ
mgnify:CR=1 FL=1